MTHQKDPRTEREEFDPTAWDEAASTEDETISPEDSTANSKRNESRQEKTDAEPVAQSVHNALFTRRSRLKKRWIFFGTLATVYVLAYCLVNIPSLKSFFTFVGGVVSPVIIGGIIAYLLNPIFKFYEYFVFRKLRRKGNLRLYLSLACSFLTGFAILAVLIAMILPELYRSISDLVNNYETYLNGLLAYIQSFINRFELDVDISDMQKLTEFITNAFGNAEDLMEKLLDKLQGFVLDSDLIGNVWAFLSSVFSSIVNFVLGLFIAFYILSSKEKRVAQARKFRAAYLGDKQESKLTEVTALVDKTFGGFFKGVMVDALIVGVLMFIALSIFRVSEYNLLIATICAITNIIPVFGPIIGAIPSGIIILMTNPEKLLLFIVIVLVIQQLDGNILVPLIQGNNTGISSMAVLISITIMGGLFGVVGMIIGVPVFAVIIELCKRAIEDRLRKQNKDTDTTHYYRKGAVGNAEEEVYYEHAHWKYKYDHSRLKPHVDKALAALTKAFSKKKAPAGGTDIPADPEAVLADTEGVGDVTDADTDTATHAAVTDSDSAGDSEE